MNANVTLVPNKVFETAGLIYVSKYFDEVSNEIQTELEAIGFGSEKRYSRYISFWTRYIKAFAKQATNLTALDFFIESKDEQVFLLYMIPVIKNENWLNDLDSVDDTLINEELFIAYQEIYNHHYQYPRKEIKVSSADDIFAFIDKTDLSQTLKWQLMQVMYNPKEYYRIIVTAINENLNAYKTALETVHVQLNKFMETFQQTIDECTKGYQELFNDEIVEVVPSVVFIFLQVFFSRTVYCGLLSNTVIKDENEIIHMKVHARDRILLKLKAISDSSKLDILLSLKERPKYNLEMADELNLTAGTMSHHMNALSVAKLVDVEKQHGRVYYVLSEEGINQFIGELSELLLH